MQIAITDGFPIGNGILTVDTEEQAMARAAIDRGDKGGDAARAMLSLIALRRKL
jgi:6,7-dimethyl-8-ribityllumazine synthase